MNPFMPESLYLVQTIPWSLVPWFDGPRLSRCTDEHRGTVVESFVDSDEAEVYRAELEREMRAGGESVRVL